MLSESLLRQPVYNGGGRMTYRHGMPPHRHRATVGAGFTHLTTPPGIPAGPCIVCGEDGEAEAERDQVVREDEGKEKGMAAIDVGVIETSSKLTLDHLPPSTP